MMKLGKLLLFLSAVLPALLLLSSVPSALSAANGSPSRVHLTWSSSDTAHSMTVTWWTSRENSGDKVLFDTQAREGNVAQYDNSSSGTYHTFSDFDGYVHDVNLTGLSPDTTYYFVCGGENGGYSREWSFKTAPTGEADVRFVGGGDSRRHYSGEQTATKFPEDRNVVSREMAERNPAFAIYSGDFVLDAYARSQWENWFGSMQKFWAASDNRMIPIIPAVGNHETRGDYEENKEDAKFYYEQFSLPGNERWYSLDWGSELHVVVLDSEVHPSDLRGSQRDWLVSDLSGHEDFRWIVVVFHRPPFSTGEHHGDYLPVRKAWAGIFDNYGVDVVINGHSHNYQRTKSVTYSEEGGAGTVPSSENGTIYLVSGGWGAPLYSAGTDELTGKVAKRHNFLLFDLSASENALTMEAFDEAGETFDSVVLPKEKEERPPAFPSIPPYLLVITAGLIIFAVVSYLAKRGGASGESHPYA